MKTKEQELEEAFNWKMWSKNWDNAYNFFNCKGNVHTKSRLKNKWNKDFMNDILFLIEQSGNQGIQSEREKILKIIEEDDYLANYQKFKLNQKISELK